MRGFVHVPTTMPLETLCDSLVRPAPAPRGLRPCRIHRKVSVGMRAYELMVIIDGDLDEDQAKSQVTSIESRCNEAGTVASTDFWGRRTFAYEINHKTEGSYEIYAIDRKSTRMNSSP